MTTPHMVYRYDRGYFSSVSLIQSDPRGDRLPDPAAEAAQPTPEQIREAETILETHHPLIRRMVTFYLEGKHPYTKCRQTILKDQMITPDFAAQMRMMTTAITLGGGYPFNGKAFGDFVPAGTPDIHFIFKSPAPEGSIPSLISRKIAAEFVLAMLFASDELKTEIIAACAAQDSPDQTVSIYLGTTWQSHNIRLIAGYLKNPAAFEKAAESSPGANLYVKVIHAAMKGTGLSEKVYANIASLPHAAAHARLEDLLYTLADSQYWSDRKYIDGVVTRLRNSGHGISVDGLAYNLRKLYESLT